MKEIEKIGKVTLNKTFYSGTDTYSDGAVEDRLLDIVQKGGREDVLLDETDWALLYHLSPIRKTCWSGTISGRENPCWKSAPDAARLPGCSAGNWIGWLPWTCP